MVCLGSPAQILGETVIIRPYESKDEKKVREFFRLHGADAAGERASAALDGTTGILAEDGQKGLLAVGFMRGVAVGRYEMVDVVVREDHAGTGLDNQVLLSLELRAERHRAKVFGVWLKSDACDDYGPRDVEERQRYHERKYVFMAYRADRFGPGLHADRLDKELKDVLAENGMTKTRRNIISLN